MIVSCPKCEKRFRFNSSVMPEGVRLKCTACSESFTATPGGGGEGSGKAPSLLVAHGDIGVCESVERALAGWDMDVIKSCQGEEAFGIIERRRPGVVLLDVALPGIYGMVLSEKIKTTPELMDTKVILVASVHNNMRYRRTPANLYGADDYIEKDDIGSELEAKVRRLLGGAEASAAPRTAEGESAGAETASRRETHSVKKAGAPSAPGPAACDDSGAKAERLARIIVADIMLYHRKKFDVDISRINIFEFFKDEICEGMKYFNKRLPSVPAKDYLINAFKEVLSKNKTAAGEARDRAAGG